MICFRQMVLAKTRSLSERANLRNMSQSRRRSRWKIWSLLYQSIKLKISWSRMNHIPKTSKSATIMKIMARTPICKVLRLMIGKRMTWKKINSTMKTKSMMILPIFRKFTLIKQCRHSLTFDWQILQSHHTAKLSIFWLSYRSQTILRKQKQSFSTLMKPSFTVSMT